MTIEEYNKMVMEITNLNNINIEERNPADDIRTFVEMHKGWVENPLLVANEELAEKARLICKENHIPIKIEVVKAKWKK